MIAVVLGGSCAASEHSLREKKNEEKKTRRMMARSRHSSNSGAQPTQAQIEPSWSVGTGRERGAKLLLRLLINGPFSRRDVWFNHHTTSNVALRMQPFQFVFKGTPEGNVYSLTFRLLVSHSACQSLVPAALSTATSHNDSTSHSGFRVNYKTVRLSWEHRVKPDCWYRKVPKIRTKDGEGMGDVLSRCD